MAEEKVLPGGYQNFLKLSETAERMNGIASQLFFAAFIIASLMLIVAVLLPRMTDERPLIPGGLRGWLFRFSGARPYLATLGMIVLLALCTSAKQLEIDNRRGFIADQDRRYEAAIKKLEKTGGSEEALRAQYLYLPEGQSLYYMTLGNPGLGADYLWLTSLQYVSNSFRRGQKFEFLLRFYNTMQELDPHWVEAISNGGKVLSALSKDRLATEKYYYTACVNNPANWQLRYEAGRMFVVPPLDIDLQKEYAQRAVAWFKDSIRLLKREPPSPRIVATIRSVEDLMGRMALAADYYDAADEMLLKQATDQANSLPIRHAAAQEWLTARSMVQVGKLQKRVDAFKKRHGHLPPSLDFLFPEKDPILGIFSKGAVAPPDSDAFGFKIEYDVETGIVSSRGIKARRAVQAAAIVNGLLETFRLKKNRAPKDLSELQQFVITLYSPPHEPATATITDALGRNLDVLTSPLGTPWEYDIQSCKVNLPPFCAPESLFRNAEKLLFQKR